MAGRWGRLRGWAGVGGKDRKLYLNSNKKKTVLSYGKMSLDRCIARNGEFEGD